MARIHRSVVLYPTPSLTRSDEEVLAGIESMRARLGRRVQDSAERWLPGFRRALTAHAVAASNGIEGFRVPTQDVRDLMDGERDVGVSEANRAETLTYQRTMTYVQSLHDVADFAYSKGLLNALHWMLQGHRHTSRKPAGQWRRGPVYVTDARNPRVAAYTAPAAADVPGLMSELVDWLNADDGTHPLIRAAMAHLHLVSIHPWPDGNGRMSRSLQTLLIAREGVLPPEFSSIEGWLGVSVNTWSYYQELQSRGATYRPDQDVSSWVRFNLTAYHQQAQAVQRRLDDSAAVWELLDTFVRDTGRDERVMSALHNVAVAGRVRRARYERAEGLTPRQAQRDLRELVTAGLLAPEARYYVEGPDFPAAVLEVARTPFPLSEPYPRG